MSGKLIPVAGWALNGNNGSGGNTSPSPTMPTGAAATQAGTALNGGLAGRQSTSGGSTPTTVSQPATQDFGGK